MSEAGIHPAAPAVSVIVVNYNTRQMTLDCLRTLTDELRETASELFVLDNASTDGSAAAIRAAYPYIKLIESETNRGFGAGNNIAMKQATGSCFLLLNTDAFPRRGAITAMMKYLDAHPEVGLVGPRLVNADGSVQRSSYRFPSPARAWAENLWISALLGAEHRWGDYRRWPHDRERHVDWVIGACCMVRREVYKQVGGFDERFFLYAEETDWQRRMRDAGWEIGFTPAAEVIHLGGASGAAEKAKINRHFFDSLDYYELKHHGVIGLVSLRAAMVVGSVLRTIAWLGVLLLVPARRAVAKGKVRLLSWLLYRQLTCWRVA